MHIAETVNKNIFEGRMVSNEAIEMSLSRLHYWNERKSGESVPEIRDELQKIMQEDFGVFRTGKDMKSGIDKIKKLRERLKYAYVPDKSKVFNTSRIEALELDNLMSVASASAICANAREESRGAHAREDFPKRDDKHWLKHTVIFPDDSIRYRAVNMKPMTVAPLEPKERHY